MSDWKLEDFDVPEVADKDRFHDYALPLPLMHAIADLGYEYCTPIQSKALPFALADFDVTGQAQTGTGKTAAFLIAVLTRFWENPLPHALPFGTPRALVLAPTPWPIPPTPRKPLPWFTTIVPAPTMEPALLQIFLQT